MNLYLFQYLILLGCLMDLSPKHIFFSRDLVWWIALVSTKEYQDFNLLLQTWKVLMSLAQTRVLDCDVCVLLSNKRDFKDQGYQTGVL
jgi:hypothetical protein